MALAAAVEPAPKAVRLDYTAPAGTATVTFSRTGPSGTPAVVRSWQRTTVTPGPVIARDFEAPIGIPLTYTAQSFNTGGAVIDTATTAITVISEGCSDTWLNDLARPVNTLQVTIEALPELAFVVPTTVHEVITRRAPIVTSDIAHTPGFDLSVLTESLDERDQVRNMLGNGVPLLLRTPPEDGIGNLFFAALGYNEQRITPDGTLAARRFVISARQVQRPDPDLYAPQGPVTYTYVRNTFATYEDMRDERASYDAVLYDWAGADPSDIVPWFPDDV